MIPRPGVLSLAFVFAIAVVWLRPPHDLDFCWQVRTGERILDTGRIRQPDPFSYTIAGKDVPDHEWLYEAGLALIWRATGDAGLKTARVVLFVAPLFVLGWQLRQRRVADYAISVFLLLCLMIFFFFERLRPLVCSTLGLQLTAGWLHEHVRGRRPLDWKLPVLFLLWANLHPAIIMGQALIAGAIGWEWVRWCWLRGNAGNDRQPWRLTGWGGAAILASLISPAPIERLTYPFSPELRHPAQRLFTEIRPPWQQPHPSPALWVALALAILFAIVAVARRRQFRLWEWALLLGVAGLAGLATRALGDWLMITTALVVPQIGECLKRGPQWLLSLDRRIKRLMTTPMFRLQPTWCLLGVGACVVAAILPWGRSLPNREHRTWPSRAADWIEAEGLPTPAPWKIHSGVNEGAYLIWRMPTQALVHADTRGFYYPGEILEDSILLAEANEGWQTQLDRVLSRGTEYFLLPTGSRLWQQLGPRIPQPLYRDDQTVIVSSDQMRAAVAPAP